MQVMSEERADYIGETLADEEIENSPTVEYRDPIKELGFAKVDHIITLDTSLSDGAYRTYALLHYYWQRKRAAWAGTDTLATIRDVKESTIRKHLKELQDAGLISRQRRMGKSSMTYLEDLPERYAEAAKAILTKRQKSSGKSARNLAVSPLEKYRLDDAESHDKTSGKTYENAQGMRTIEREPKEEEPLSTGDSKNESPQLDQTVTFESLKRAEDEPAQPVKDAAIQVFHDVRGKNPPRETYAQIEDAVGCEPAALDFWRKVLVEYAALGWNRQSVSGPLDWFRKHELPHLERKNGGSKPADKEGSVDAIHRIFEELRNGDVGSGRKVIDVSPGVP